MTLESNDDEKIHFTITWEQYACLKKPHGCCNTDCEGCCYIPPRKLKNNKSVDTKIKNQIRFIIPSFSPSLSFHEQIDPNTQVKICNKIRDLNADKQTWNLYFGTNIR